METLYSLAEIAIGMAGFSAIVVIFKRHESGHWRAVDADRFNGMIIHSICAVLFCLLPAAIGAFVVIRTTVWTICSAVLGLQVLFHAITIIRLSTTGMPGLLLIGVFGSAVVVLQAFNVFGVFFSGSFGPYLLGVLWHLLQAGVLFVMLVWVRAEDIDRP